jgi:hypothetical protein
MVQMQRRKERLDVNFMVDRRFAVKKESARGIRENNFMRRSANNNGKRPFEFNVLSILRLIVVYR